ncbi:MAG: helix-turn-helix transcriptional regulator [Weeksellaceae bacterium]
MYHDIFNTILVLSIFEGFILTGIALFSKKKKNKSYLFLILIILAFTLNNLQYFFLVFRLISSEKFFGLLFFPFAALTPVLYLLFFKFLLYPKRKLTKTRSLLFLPSILSFIIALYYKIKYLTDGITEEIRLLYNKIYLFQEVFGVVFLFVIVGYVFIMISGFEKEQNANNITKYKGHTRWLKVLNSFSLLLSLVWMLAIVQEFILGGSELNYFYFLWVGIAVYIYLLGYTGIYHFNEFFPQIPKTEQKIQEVQIANAVKKIVELKTYPKSEHVKAFEALIMEEDKFLDSDIKLEDLANELNLSKSYLSRLINSELGYGFSECINKLRIEHAKKILSNPNLQHQNMLKIAKQSGFKSKSNFFTTFKKITGETPADFQKKNLS